MMLTIQMGNVRTRSTASFLWSCLVRKFTRFLKETFVRCCSDQDGRVSAVLTYWTLLKFVFMHEMLVFAWTSLAVNISSHHSQLIKRLFQVTLIDMLVPLSDKEDLIVFWNKFNQLQVSIKRKIKVSTSWSLAVVTENGTKIK